MFVDIAKLILVLLKKTNCITKTLYNILYDCFTVDSPSSFISLANKIQSPYHLRRHMEYVIENIFSFNISMCKNIKK